MSVDKQFPEFDDDKGITLVLINTTNGQQLFDSIKDKTTYISTDFEKGAQYNLAVSKSLGLHPKRQYFFDNLEKKTLKELEAEILPPGLHPKRQYFFDNLENKTLKELEAEILPPV